MIRDSYSNDLLEGARRSDTGDGIEFRLPLAVRFNRLLLEEDLSKGERVEEFALDVWEEGWKEVARGTNIGHRRIFRFPEQNAAAIRVRILKSRARVHLSRISAFNHETL